MTRMKDKIKNFFGFIGRAWRGGPRGKLGVFFALFAVFMFARIFWGDVNVGKFVTNIFELNSERTELAIQQQKLDKINLHIKLLRIPSPDYVEELGLKRLNVGDSEYKILKY